MLRILRAAGESFDLAGLERVIAQLLKTGLADGFLSIQARKTRKCLELTKYIHSKGDYGIRVHVPIERWSEPYLVMVQAYCAKEGIESFLQNHDPEVEILSLCIDCQKNVSKAYNIVKVIFTEIFHVPDSSIFSVVLRNCAPWDELIDDPDQESLSWTEGLRRDNIKIQESIGVSLSDLSLNMLLSGAQIGGVIGLAYSLAFSKGTWTWTGITIAGTSTNAPILGLFFCSVILISFFRIATRSFWVIFHKNEINKRHSRIFTILFKVRYALFNYLNIISVAIMSIAASKWVAI